MTVLCEYWEHTYGFIYLFDQDFVNTKYMPGARNTGVWSHGSSVMVKINTMVQLLEKRNAQMH